MGLLGPRVNSFKMQVDIARYLSILQFNWVCHPVSKKHFSYSFNGFVWYSPEGCVNGCWVRGKEATGVWGLLLVELWPGCPQAWRWPVFPWLSREGALCDSASGQEGNPASWMRSFQAVRGIITWDDLRPWCGTQHPPTPNLEPPTCEWAAPSTSWIQPNLDFLAWEQRACPGRLYGVFRLPHSSALTQFPSHRPAQEGKSSYSGLIFPRHFGDHTSSITHASPAPTLIYRFRDICASHLNWLCEDVIWSLNYLNQRNHICFQQKSAVFTGLKVD